MTLNPLPAQGSELRSILKNLTFITSMASNKIEHNEITREEGVKRIHDEIDEAMAMVTAYVERQRVEVLANLLNHHNSIYDPHLGQVVSAITIEKLIKAQLKSKGDE